MTDIASPQLASSPVSKEHDSKMFDLLFQECSEGSSGWATVDSLIARIRELVPGSPAKGEDVYDSDDSFKEAQYNLELLRCMLDNHAINGEINEASYSHVIRNWANNVCSRSNTPDDSHSVNISNEETTDNGVITTALFQESFETTGGASSSHEMEYQQLLSTKLELESGNKRLTEINQRLLAQVEGAEESVRQIQSENSELKEKFKIFQQNLAYLESVKQEKSELADRLTEEERLSEELKETIEAMNHEIIDLRVEISDLQNQLTSSETDKDELYNEVQALNQLVTQKEEHIEAIENERQLMEAQLEEQNQETLTLQQALTNTNEMMEELKNENTSLQGRLNEPPAPVYSTPFRSQALSLHDEMAECDFIKDLSPLSSSAQDVNNGYHDQDEENMEDDEFSAIANKKPKSKAKFDEKASLLHQGVSELIDKSLTSLGSDKSTTDSFMSSKENIQEVVETTVKRGRKKEKQRVNKLLEELNTLKEENKRLKDRIDQLKMKLKNEDNVGGVAATPSDVHLLLTTPPVQVTSFIPRDDCNIPTDDNIPIVPIDFDSIPTAITSIPGAVNGSLTANTSTPGDIHSIPTAITSIPGAVNGSPTAITSTPGDIHSIPTAITSIPGAVNGSPTAITSTPGDVHSIPTAITSIPGDIHSIPMAISSISGAVNSSIPGAVTDSLIAITSIPEDIDNTPTNNNIIVHADGNDILVDINKTPTDVNNIPIVKTTAVAGVQTSSSAIVKTTAVVGIQTDFVDTPIETTPIETTPNQPTLAEYQLLQQEVDQLKEQLALANSVPSIQTITIEPINIEQAWTSAHEESRLENILVPPLESSREATPSIIDGGDITSEEEDNLISPITTITPAPVSEPNNNTWFSMLFGFIWAVMRGSLWLLLMIVVVLSLVVLLVSVNSSLGRCGGKFCSDSPLHMILGQHLKFINSGHVPL